VDLNLTLRKVQMMIFQLKEISGNGGIHGQTVIKSTIIILVICWGVLVDVGIVVARYWKTFKYR
jgi:hypothetical protein